MFRIPIYPVLFSVYPVLFVFSANLGEVEYREIWAPSALMISVSLLLWGALCLVRYTKHNSSLYAFFILMAFMSFGMLNSVISTIALFRGNELAVFYLWILFLLVGIRLIYATTSRVETNYLLNLTMMILFVFPLVNILTYDHVSLKDIGIEGNSVRVGSPIQTRVQNLPYPDIYEIILDGYGGRETLDRLYGFDNSPFIEELQSLGFQYAENARSNYCQTLLSLTALYEMDFVHNIYPDLDPSISDRKILARNLSYSRVFQILTDLGYSKSAYASGYYFTELSGFDDFIVSVNEKSSFQNTLLEMTPIPAIARLTESGALTDPHVSHAKHISGVLGAIGTLDHKTKPLYVTAHLVCPHPPFIFRSNGDFSIPNRPFILHDGSHLRDLGVSSEEYQKLYISQLEYLNRMVLSAVHQILESNGKNEPVILIFADHGPASLLDWDSLENSDLAERLKIPIFAYFPYVRDQLLYDGMSLVNLYPLVLNQYMRLGLELNDDRSFYTTWNRPYNFREVTEQL